MDSHEKMIAHPHAHPLTALIVDDEIGAINALRQMLGEYCPQVQILGAAITIREAVSAAAALRPQLVFLDIEMPPLGSGFDFLAGCEEIDFGVIFTTAYPQYAIKAINTVQPWAYLVKPFSVKELREALMIAAEKIWLRNHAALHAAGKQGLVLHDSRKGTIVLYAADILFCKASGSFTEFYVFRNNKPEKIMSSGGLGEFEEKLPATLFCRTHHSYLVNLAHVTRLERTGRNGVLHLANTDRQAAVSVAKMDHFFNCLEAFHRTNPCLKAPEGTNRGRGSESGAI